MTWSRWRLAGAFSAAAVLVGSARRARGQEVSAAEERSFRTLNRAPNAIHVPVWAVMQAGSLAAVGVTTAELLRRKRPQTAAAAALAGTLVWGGVKAVKPLVGRGRPERHLDDVMVRGQPQSGLGFPSGHAAVSLTLALISTHGRNPSTRAAGLAVAGITGGARMYVGAHLPLDLVGGYAIGALCGSITNLAVDRYRCPPASAESSVFPAVQNLLLAATALGLGSALTTIATFAADDLRSLVGLPDHVDPIAVVPIGHAAVALGPNRRDPVASRTHRERYGTAW